MLNLFNAEYLLEREPIFVGAPETVTRQLKQAAGAGVFNTFMGEHSFADLREENLMRSMRLFGEQVIAVLRDFEPYLYLARGEKIGVNMCLPGG